MGPDIVQAFTDTDDVAHHGCELRRRAGNIVAVVLHTVEQVHQQRVLGQAEYSFRRMDVLAVDPLSVQCVLSLPGSLKMMDRCVRRYGEFNGFMVDGFMRGVGQNYGHFMLPGG